MSDFKMNKELLSGLMQPLEVKKRKGSGNQFYEYVSIDDVIDRLNSVFEGNWSSETSIVNADDKGVIVSAVVTAGGVSHSGYGGSQMAGEVGAAYKSAKSKAIKDAAKAFGVGVHDEDDTQTGQEPTNFKEAPKSNFQPPTRPTPPSNSNKPVEGQRSIPGFSNTKLEIPKEMPGKVTGPPMDMQTAPVKNIPGFTPPVLENNPKPTEQESVPAKNTKSLVNDVQKSAIDNALRVRATTYDELWEEAVIQLGLDPETTAKELDSLDRVVASRMVANSHTKGYK